MYCNSVPRDRLKRQPITGCGRRDMSLVQGGKKKVQKSSRHFFKLLSFCDFATHVIGHSNLACKLRNKLLKRKMRVTANVPGREKTHLRLIRWQCVSPRSVSCPIDRNIYGVYRKGTISERLLYPPKSQNGALHLSGVSCSCIPFNFNRGCLRPLLRKESCQLS